MLTEPWSPAAWFGEESDWASQPHRMYSAQCRARKLAHIAPEQLLLVSVLGVIARASVAKSLGILGKYRVEARLVAMSSMSS